MYETINWIGVLAAGVAGYVFGAAYYTVMGNRWLAALDLTKEDIAARKSKLPFVIAAVGQFVMAATLSVLTGPGTAIGPSVALALLLWIGIVMVTLTVNHSFQGRKPALTVIDGLHWLGVLVLQSVLLAVI